MPAALTDFDVVGVHIHAVHETIEGSMYLWVSEPDEGYCIARIQGRQVDCGHVVASTAEGVRQNNMRFLALFPEHICSTKCRRHDN
jgi:hypothetical protein